MKKFTQRISERDQICKAADELGAEPLAGSGFDDQTPEEGFTDTALAAESAPQ